MAQTRSLGYHAAGNEQHKHTNRLTKEQSPYLLQHAHNPVDWYPWSEEAFDLARKEDKPIFLSVGYATCHWCHVMERESFEDEETAKVMNEHFVNIKVDREERPDVDKIYMMYVQALSGGGGWPMSVFLTPDLQPFYGGTYYPKTNMVRGGQLVQPSFTALLLRVAELWRDKKDVLKHQGEQDMSKIAQFISEQEDDEAGASREADGGGTAVLAKCVQQLHKRFDRQLGGFGPAPKFPRPCEINSLLAAYLHLLGSPNGEDSAFISPAEVLHMAELTLQRMAAGGMWDHVGGGFHRYSVDEFWHVPHFEKMLYDNPQLAVTYLDAFRLTGQGGYARTVRGILDYLRRGMTHPQGGLYSAEDADSLDPRSGEKREGFFYAWSREEVEEVLRDATGSLPSGAAALFLQHYNVKPEGNCDKSPRSDPHKEFDGLNVLAAEHPVSKLAGWHNMSEADAELALAACRAALFARRETRPRPALDDKVVTAWNGLTISAFALASRALSNEDVGPSGASPGLPLPSSAALFPVEGVSRGTYLSAAQRAAAFAREQLWDNSAKRLRRSFCKAPSAVTGFADDYALMIAGLLDLYECGGGRQHLEWALELQRVQDELFWDAQGGAYYQTSGEDPSIKLRLKEDYDGAEPAASSIAAANLLRLAALVPGVDGSAGEALLQRSALCRAAMRARLREAPITLPQMTVADFLADRVPFRQVVVAGRLGDASTSALLDAVHAPLAPDKAVIVLDLADKADVAFWTAHNPEALAVAQAQARKAAPGGTMQATVFVCQNFTCQAPSNDPARVRQLLAPAGTATAAPRLTPMQAPFGP